VGLQDNNMAIDGASTQLVNQFAQQVVTLGSDLRTLIQQNIVDKLSALDGSNPKLPVGPEDIIRELVQHAIESQEQELAEAIRTGAQARVNRLKTQLSNIVSSKLNRSFSFYDSWTDPVIGLRGRFNLNKTFYLTAQTEVGEFGIGSDIAVEAYAALGCQFARNIFSEVGYRYYYDDFRDGNFLYQLSLHGAQVTVGLTF
jgi:hypothetical protein